MNMHRLIIFSVRHVCKRLSSTGRPEFQTAQRVKARSLLTQNSRARIKYLTLNMIMKLLFLRLFFASCLHYFLWYTSKILQVDSRHIYKSLRKIQKLK